MNATFTSSERHGWDIHVFLARTGIKCTDDGREADAVRHLYPLATPSARTSRLTGPLTGALQEGGADLVYRLLPETSDADWDAALAAAQDYLLSLGVTGWQDAIIGGFDGARDNLPVYLRAAEIGTAEVTATWIRGRPVYQS